MTSMDYKKAIEILRSMADNYVLPGVVDALETAIRAMEELPKVEAERDAALKDMRGICYLCKKAEPSNIGLRTLKTCEHLKERGVLATNKRPGCQYFEWRGPQKEGH